MDDSVSFSAAEVPRENLGCLLYGLRIAHQRPLPELSSASFDVPDVRLVDGDLGSPVPMQDFIFATPMPDERVYVGWRKAGLCLVEGGNRIVVDDAGCESPLDLRMMIYHQVFSALLLQRGLRLIHGSAVRLGGKSVIFSGTTGSGKSTLAACLQAKGGVVLADDVCALDLTEGPGVKLLPGLAALKLDEASTRASGRAGDEGVELTGTRSRKLFSAGSTDVATALTAVFFLEEGPALEIKRLHPKAAFLKLLSQSYGGNLAHGIGKGDLLFSQLSRISTESPIYTLSRPKDLGLMPGIIDQILATVGHG